MRTNVDACMEAMRNRIIQLEGEIEKLRAEVHSMRYPPKFKAGDPVYVVNGDPPITKHELVYDHGFIVVGKPYKNQENGLGSWHYDLLDKNDFSVNKGVGEYSLVLKSEWNAK